ncbi:hypothetical protein NDU88_005664 [Pleurodeles waltl]|uniref:Uncharacterized protein n=1 Tax=Pleurodeles waltl TaxID=8319 RepID=A0AAV7RN04_PLEWA|nr:hypothetical protein NDU88_005664 [Pleurodeles waltl]
MWHGRWRCWRCSLGSGADGGLTERAAGGSVLSGGAGGGLTERAAGGGVLSGGARGGGACGGAGGGLVHRAGGGMSLASLLGTLAALLLGALQKPVTAGTTVPGDVVLGCDLERLALGDRRGGGGEGKRSRFDGKRF